jgi:hypothetical protein
MNVISDALAIVLDEIDVHATEEIYSDPEVAARIESVRVAMAELQLFLDQRVN